MYRMPVNKKVKNKDGKWETKHFLVNVPTYNYVVNAAAGEASSVSGSAGPLAVFTWTPITGSAPYAAQMVDQSLGNITNWSWNFGDGPTTSSLKNPTHTYTSSNQTYVISLSVTSSAGRSIATSSIHIG